MDDFTRVKDAVDLVDVVNRYVPLKRAGTRMVGLCPFHAEKSPSFGIPVGQSYFKCFGCGKGGDVFTFLSEHLRISRADALHQLADEHGITLSRGPGADSGQREAREQAQKALAAAQELFRKAYATSPLGDEARELLARRKLTPATIDAFAIGFSPANPADRFRSAVICDRLIKAGHRREDVVACGIGVALDREPEGGATADGAEPEKAPETLIDAPLIRGRVTFPIRDESGRVIAFGSRRLRDLPDSKEPKYVNSRETLLFSKSRVLYGLDRARAQILKERQVVLVEGYLDVILSHQGGLTTAVAALGTAITPDHARAFKRLEARVVLFLDSDEAGQRAAERAVPILMAAQLEVKVLVLREDKDPGDFFARGKTREEFDALLQRDGVAAIEFLIARSGGRAARGIDERIAVARKVAAAFEGQAEPLVRAALINHLARSLDLPAENLDAALGLRGARRPVRFGPEARPAGDGASAAGSAAAPGGDGETKVLPAAPEGKPVPPAQVLAEEWVLTALLRDPALRSVLRTPDLPVEFGEPRRARLFQCLMEEPAGDADGLVEALIGRLAAEPETQQTLTDLVSRPASAEPGDLLDGAWRWFLKRRREQRADQLRERWRGALQAGDPTAAAEFLRQYQQLRQDDATN